ncbi:Centractin [Balamuthia mandrillaris]
MERFERNGVGCVFDFGSSSLRYGYAEDSAPWLCELSCRGTLRKCMSSASGYVMLGGHCASDVVGNAAQQHRGILSLDYPVKRGLIQNWESFEKLLEHCILYLHILPRDEPLTFCHSPYHPPASNNRLCEVVFEKLGTTALKLGTHAELAALATGRETALIVDLGAGRTTVSPFYSGYLLKPSIRHINFGGADILEYLARLVVNETGYSVTTSSEREILQLILRDMCYVSQERPLHSGNDTQAPTWADSPLPYSETQAFELPDGNTLCLGDALKQSPEVVFNPALLGREIETCPSTPAKHCSSGIANPLERLQAKASPRASLGDELPNELWEQVRSKVHHHNAKRINIVEDPRLQQFASWTGGAIFASMSEHYEHMPILRSEYEEQGPSCWRKYSAFASPFSSPTKTLV